MSEKSNTINNLLHPQARFMRSVNLERDFEDKNALNGYVLTDHSREALTRIATGLEPSSTQRAWRITGNYGSGKSSFALLLSHWISGHKNMIPGELESEMPSAPPTTEKTGLLPVLVVGAREPLSKAIARGLINAINSVYPKSKTPKFILKLKKLLSSEVEASKRDEYVVKALKEASSQVVKDKKASGLFIVVDELGKFLEYATLYPDQQDIYVLQQIAESATRSQNTPIYIVALLHQGFNEYANTLSEVAQREWEKVAARFDEILFNQPLEQLSRLIAAALNIQSEKLPEYIASESEAAMEEYVESGWFGFTSSKETLTKNADKIFPLHPSVIPVLARFFRRYGQNERSLFSFLVSNEPFGLRAFSERSVCGDPFFRLHNLYDYVRCNFGHRLAARSYRSHWNQIDSIIQSHVSIDPIETETLKTIGILNLLDSDDLLPNQHTLTSSLVFSDDSKKADDVQRFIDSLQSEKRVIYQRGQAGGYCLWPYTSVNLELAYERATDSIPLSLNVSSKVEKYIETRPLVARRHYIETGNLRYFDVHYLPVEELSQAIENLNGESDGTILVALCETKQERSDALDFAIYSDFVKTKADGVIIAIPPPLNNLAGLVAEAERWDWILQNTRELENDNYALEEVSRQKKAARTALENRLGTFMGLRQFSSETSLECFHLGKHLQVTSGRDLLRHISTLCDNLYDEAPSIKHELVNRQYISSAAAGARMRLIENMLANPAEPYLGMDETKKPPEMSMYLSVLKLAGLHREHEGSWGISRPKKDSCNILPSWEKIEELLQTEPDSRVCVKDIETELLKRPYGIRKGIFPILLAAYYVANRDKIALYEEGTFCTIVHKEEFLRLTKAPESFELQYCQTNTIRSEVLHKLWRLIADENSEEGDIAVLDVVRPICEFVASLPEYSRLTRKLSQTAMAVRSSILDAQDPTHLLFYSLPEACGCEPISTTKQVSASSSSAFVKLLRAALTELRTAYPDLIERIMAELSFVFDIKAEEKSLRENLSTRAKALLPNISEPRLKSFCVRLADEKLPTREWLESLASLLAKCPPAKWKEKDEGQFQHELAILGTRFMRVEGLFFEKGSKSFDASDMRVTLTKSDGQEHDRVISSNDSTGKEITDLKSELLKIINDNGNTGLKAASMAIWEIMSDRGDQGE